MYAAAREALRNAREGRGPTLIEAFTYRMGDHTTADDASRYRSDEEVREWERRGPILRFRQHLAKKGLWDESYEKEVGEEAARLVEKAVAEAEARPAATLDDISAYTYAAMPPDLEAQLADLKAFTAEGAR